MFGLRASPLQRYGTVGRGHSESMGVHGTPCPLTYGDGDGVLASYLQKTGRTSGPRRDSNSRQWFGRPTRDREITILGNNVQLVRRKVPALAALAHGYLFNANRRTREFA